MYSSPFLIHNQKMNLARILPQQENPAQFPGPASTFPILTLATRSSATFFTVSQRPFSVSTSLSALVCFSMCALDSAAASSFPLFSLHASSNCWREYDKVNLQVYKCFFTCCVFLLFCFFSICRLFSSLHCYF